MHHLVEFWDKTTKYDFIVQVVGRITFFVADQKVFRKPKLLFQAVLKCLYFIRVSILSTAVLLFKLLVLLFDLLLSGIFLNFEEVVESLIVLLLLLVVLVMR